jgi:hypothetical protein
VGRNDHLTYLISLFGFSAEEILEAGARYEDVSGFRGLLQ